MQQQHVAWFDHDVVGAQDVLQHRPVHADPVVAVVRMQVDQHAAALHAVERHVLETEVMRERAATTRRVRGGPDQVDAGAVAVVIDRLLHAVAIGVELGADVGE